MLRSEEDVFCIVKCYFFAEFSFLMKKQLFFVLIHSMLPEIESWWVKIARLFFALLADDAVRVSELTDRYFWSSNFT